MLRMGLDIGTGFVKCVSNYGSARFPSIYVRRTHGDWASSTTEAVGEKAARMLHTPGAAAVRPIARGRPDQRYAKHAEMLVAETVRRIREGGGRSAESEPPVIAVGLPYDAFDCRDAVLRMVKKSTGATECMVLTQAVGTLVDMGMSTGMVVSVGQGTTEIIVIEDNEVIDGESSEWASEFITRKISKFAHLDTDLLARRKDVCKKHARTLADGLAAAITDMASTYGNPGIALSGGGILIPGVRDELVSRLKGITVKIPEDPVMSNASGLYKLVK